MYVTKVVIMKVRGFDQVVLDLSHTADEYAGWTVLAGRNGSGKSTLLKSIALAAAGPTTARRLMESFGGWVREGEEQAIVAVEILPSKGDRWDTRGRPPMKPLMIGLQWSMRSDASSNGRRREPQLESIPSKVRKWTADHGPWTDNPNGWFISGYGPFRRLTGHASDAQRLMVSPYHAGRLVSLFREDASLVESVQWLKEVHTRSLENRAGSAELKQAILALLDDGLLPAGMRVVKFDADGLWVEQGGVTLALDDLSDGYRTVAAFVLDLCRNLHECYGELPLTSENDGHQSVDLPGVVLIDEMDVHLHVSWQQQIGFWLKKHFPGIQFIVATHSPFICQAADPHGLIRLPGPGDTGSAAQVSPEVYHTVVNGGVDEAVLTELFGLDRPHSEQAEKLRVRVAQLEARDLEGTITEEESAELERLQRLLPARPGARIAQALRTLRNVP